jgi:tetratricopeptide (TPR) repeat protein
MNNFERRIRSANRPVFFLLLVGIFIAVWLSMFAYKTGFPLYASISLGEIIVFTSYFIGLMLVRTSHRLWQIIKFIIPTISLSLLWLVPWVGIVLGLGAAIELNVLLCLIAYKISPELKIDDKILNIMVWSGGKDKEKTRKRFNEQILNKSPFIRRRLSRIEELNDTEPTVSRALHSLKLVKQIISELELVENPNFEVTGLLGRAYISQAKALLVLTRPGESAQAYSIAKSFGADDESLNATLAVSYVTAGSRTRDAFHAYIAYLKQDHTRTNPEERNAVTNILQSMCGFGDPELSERTIFLSRTLSYAALGVRFTYPHKDSERPVNEIIADNQAVIAADPDIPWAHYYLGLGFLFTSVLGQALSEFKIADRLKPGSYPIAYYTGLTYASEGNTEKALAQFQSVAATSPEYPDAQFHAGRLHIAGIDSKKNIFTGILKSTDKAQSAKAIASLDKAIELQKERADYYFYTGLAHFQAGNYRTVIELMAHDVCMEHPPKEFYFLLALAHYSLKEYKAARNFTEQTLKIDSSYQLAYNLLARIWFAEGDWVKAEVNCRQAIKLDATDKTARSVLGQSLFAQAKYIDTVTELGQLVQTGDNEVIYCYGQALVKIDRFKEGITQLERLKNSEYAFHIFYLLGCAYAHLGQVPFSETTLKKALSWFNRAAEVTPSDPKVFLQRANIYLLVGSYTNAYDDIQSFHNLGGSPSSYEMGLYYQGIGDQTRALSEFQEAVKNNPADYRALFAQGLTKETNEDFTVAEQLYKATSVLHNSTEVQFQMGIIHSKMGRNKEAIAELTALRKSGTDNDTLRYYLGKALASSGNYEPAITEWDGLFQKYPDDRDLGNDIFVLHNLRAIECFTRKEYENSIRHWEACLRYENGTGIEYSMIRKSIAEAYFRVGIAHLRQNTSQGSLLTRKAITNAASFGERKSVYDYYLAITYINTGELDSAISLLQKLTDADPENGRYQYQLASALIQGKEYEKALPLLEAITSKDDTPNQVGATMLLAECYKGLGNWQRAAETAGIALVGSNGNNGSGKIR